MEFAQSVRYSVYCKRVDYSVCTVYVCSIIERAARFMASNIPFNTSFELGTLEIRKFNFESRTLQRANNQRARARLSNIRSE